MVAYKRTNKFSFYELAEICEDEGRRIETTEKAFRPEFPMPERIHKMQAFYSMSRFFALASRNPEIFKTAIQRAMDLEAKERAQWDEKQGGADE